MVYFTAIVFFSLFRVVLFFTEIGRINNAVEIKDVLLSFIMGVRFDVVISSYILVLPFVIVAIASFFKQQSRIVVRLITYYIIILFTVAFFVSTIDIPYFNQFFSRFSIAAFDWADSPVFVLKMIVQEPQYWFFILSFPIISYLFYRIVNKVFTMPLGESNIKVPIKISLSIIFLFLILIGIRGRIEEKSPIRVGTAFFSSNPFLNQLGLNPNFTLIRSYLDSIKKDNKKIKLMDDFTAISNVQKYFNISKPDETFPLLRHVEFDAENASNYNVVLVIMESMSAAKMKRHGNKDNLTPFLDSISNAGYYFENTYTAGIHTHNGIFSSLFSYPAIFRQHAMKNSNIPKYSGIFSTLKNYGYATIYFTTHDGQFDNVEGFLKANDCEMIISKPDYPSDKVKTTLGVPDDFMFEFSIPILNKLSQEDKPFFAAFMTASDHRPYYLPEYFEPRNTDIKKQITEYADYSLQKFIDLSSKQEWFSNTIFVFIADHGKPMDNVYSMSIDYNHAPLVFYAPHIFTESKTMSDMAGQIDIFPTIMGLLKLKYANNTLGIDLFKEKRPYIFFNGDDKYGVIDNEWFLIVNNTNAKGLYKYRDLDTYDYSGERSDVVEKMNEYAQSNLQAYQYVLITNKQ